MVHFVYLFMKMYLLVLLQDNYLDLVHCAFLCKLSAMHEEYNSVVSIPSEAENISHFGRYRYIGKTQISARPIYRFALQQCASTINL